MASERWLCASCGATSDPSPEPPPGCARCDAPLHVGKFGLLQELDAERSARVFRGRESSGRAEVSVRLFPENVQLDFPSIRQAVKRAASLSHPGIAAPLDVGTHRNRVFVAEAAAPGVPIVRADLTLREAVSVMRGVALALDYAHGRGVVHPDLRAENVRVSKQAGDAIGESAWRGTITCFGIAGGGSVRDNVGAFGSILYAAATGSPPRRSGPVPIAPSSINPLVDSELESIILMAMDSNGSRQPPSMETIAAELSRWLDGGDRPRSTPKMAPAATVPAVPLQPWKTWGLLGASVVVVLLLIYLVIRKAPPPLEPVPVVRTPPSKPAELPPPSKPQPPVPSKVEPPAEAPTPPPPPPKSVEEKPAPPPPPPVEEKPVPPPPKPAPVEEKPAPPPPKPAPPEDKPLPSPKPPPVEEKPAPVPAPAPKPEPVPAPPPPPPPKPVEEKAPAAGASVGEMYGGHPDFGKFVRLNGKENPVVGDTLLVLRNGKVVGRLSVKRLTAPQRRYPQGCAVCAVLEGDLQDGDDVRRVSP
jgi:serine/threonine protein kinase